MKNNPLISVIVPVYMTDKYTGICIESIINQTYKNLEIILVDDGSTDLCPAICDLYASKDSRIKVIHKPNGGLVSGRKAGIQAAKGEYVGYVDGDDWIGPGYYQSLFYAIDDSKADIAVAGFSRDLFSVSEPLLNAIPSGIYEGESLKYFYKNMIAYGQFFNHGITTYFWNKLFRREAIFDFQMAVENDFFVLEDGSAIFPAMLSAKKIVVTDNCAYHYRQREGSMLKSVANLKRESQRLLSVYDFLHKVVECYPKEYELDKQVDDLMLSTYIVRFGGFVGYNHEDTSNFIYKDNLDGKRVVIYGAGTYGQQMYNRLKACKILDLVGWVDQDYWEYRRCCMNVDPVSSVVEKEFDYVIIANLSDISVDKATKQLTDYGVSSTKILSFHGDEKNNKALLQQYLKME